MKKAFSLIETIFTLIIMSTIMLTLPILISKSVESIKELKRTSHFQNAKTQVRLTLNKMWDENNVEEYEDTQKYSVLVSTSTDNNNSLLDCTSNYRDGHYEEVNRRKCNTEDLEASVIGLDGTESPQDLNLDDIDDFNNVEQRIIDYDKLKTSTIDAVDDASGNTGDGTVIRNYINKILSEPLTSDSSVTISSLATDYDLTEEIITEIMITLAYLKIDTSIEYIDYLRKEETDTSTNITTITVNPNIVATSETTDIKKITIKVTELKDNNSTIQYHYYSTNIGTDQVLKRLN